MPQDCMQDFLNVIVIYGAARCTHLPISSFSKSFRPCLIRVDFDLCGSNLFSKRAGAQGPIWATN